MKKIPPDTVVCAVGGNGSSAAVAAAADEAARARTGLHLVHVTAGPYAPEAEALLADAAALARTRHPELQITQRVVDSAWVAAGLAESGEGARCVVIERTHRSRAHRVVAGSVPGSVAYKVRAPVLSVPHGWTSDADRPATVTVAVQDATEAPTLVGLGLLEAHARGADVVVLHATGDDIDDVGIRTDWIDRAHRELDPVVEVIARNHPDVKVRVEVVLRRPAEALVAASAESALLVVGRRHHDHVWGTNIGPVVRRVLLDATCPVLLPRDLGPSSVVRPASERADEAGKGHVTPGDVVVAVGADDAGGSVRFAVAEAAARQSGVHLVHVVQVPGVDGVSIAEIWQEAVAEGRRLLERATEQAKDAGRPGLRVTTHLVERGSTVGALVAESTGASAIVIQHRRLGRGRRLVTWSVTNGVAARSDVPVIAVPAEWSAGPERIGCVVAGIAGLDDVDQVVRGALAEAERRGLALRVVHAGPVSTADRAALDRAIDEIVLARPTVSTHRVFDDHDPVSLLVGAMTSAELVVLGRRHHTLQPGSHLGPVTRAVLDASTYPVMLLPRAARST